jgi:hypothetical protein
VRVATRSEDEHLRVEITDGEGHWLRIAVVGPTRRVRFEASGPGGTVAIRGDLDQEFEDQLKLLREHGTNDTVGIAGRFHVFSGDPTDKPGYVDWGNGGPTVWIYPNRRGASTDWARFPMNEVLEDFEAVLASHRGR